MVRGRWASVASRRVIARDIGSYQWYVLGLAGCVAFVLGYIGLSNLGEWSGEHPSRTDIAYDSLKLFLLTAPDTSGHTPRALDVARYLAPFVAGFAGLNALRLLLWDRVQQMRIPFLKRHVVVCGLGYVGSVFVRHLRERGQKVVVIDADNGNTNLELCRRLRVPVIRGDAQQKRTLRAAGVERAARLIAVCDFDAINSEIVASAEKVLVEGRVKSELHCLARINDPDLCRQFRIHSARRDEKVASLDFLNIDDVAARYLLDEFGFDNGCTRPHILVAHLDPLGQWLVVQAALDWQVTDHGDNAPLHVSVLDDDAERRISSLSAEHPYAARVCTFHHASLSAGGMRDLLLAQQASPDVPPINYAFVTAFRDEHGLETAMKLQHQIESLGTEVPIVAALSRSHGVSSLVHDAGRHRQDGDPLKIKVFQTLEHACTTDVLEAGLMETTLARHIHDKWRDMMKDEPGEHPEWDEAGELDRESSRAQARDIPFKLRKINCMIGPLRDNEVAHQLSDGDIETLARDEHNRWWKEHIAAGWSYAEKKCKKSKHHPDMRPYDQLSRSDGDKDVEFMRAIPDLLAKMNLRIVERPAEPNGPSNGRRSPLGWFRRQRPGG